MWGWLKAVLHWAAPIAGEAAKDYLVKKIGPKVGQKDTP